METGGHIVRVTVQARGFWCEGDVLVPRPGGYKGRVLDLLNESREFLALTDVLLYRSGEGPGGTGGAGKTGEAGGTGEAERPDDDPVEYDVLLLRKNEIQFVVPLD